nr:bacterial effector [uncultured bacterium]
MTVSTEISSNEYTGNGVTTDFDYKFRIFKANQLSVITSDADGDNVVTLRLGTDYTVTGANKSAGGKVVLTKPLANGHKISIARDIPITQETSFRNQSKFFAETHEEAFDYLTMIVQRIWGSLGSLYLKRPNILANWFDAKGYRIANLGKPKRDSDAVDLGTLKGEIEGVNSTILAKEKCTLRVDDMDIAALPKASERAGNVLTFDKDGRPIAVAPASGSAIDVLNLLASEKGASYIDSGNLTIYKKTGLFGDGGTVTKSNQAVKDSDGFWYVYLGSFPHNYGDLHTDDWACVGLLSGYHVDNVKNYLTPTISVIDAFNLAQNSKYKRGGGCIYVPAGDYYLEDELALIDFVRFVGEGERVTRIFGAPSAIGKGKAVVRSSKLPITTTENPAYLSHTGFTDATINGNGVFDVGLYIRNTTNESKFTNVTTQNCKVANTNIISSWYVNMDNHVSRDALGYGVVIGRKLFNEVGLDEVNACSFLNLRSNYSGKDDTYDPVNAPYAGSGITIWKAASCAFDYVGAENSYGVGLLVRKGITSKIPVIYTEANGRGSKATAQIGMYVIDADFAPLLIDYLNLTSKQKVYLGKKTNITLGSIYTHDFNQGCFLGEGNVILNNPQDVNYLNSNDLTYVRNIQVDALGSFCGISLSNRNALDNSAFYTGLDKYEVLVVFNPNKTFTLVDPMIIRFGSIDVNFGSSFTEGIVVKRKISISKGVVRLRQRSNTLPSESLGAYADIFIIQYRVLDFPVYNYN